MNKSVKIIRHCKLFLNFYICRVELFGIFSKVVFEQFLMKMEAQSNY